MLSDAVYGDGNGHDFVPRSDGHCEVAARSMVTGGDGNLPDDALAVAVRVQGDGSHADDDALAFRSYNILMAMTKKIDHP